MILHLLRMRRNVNRNVFNDRKNVSATPPSASLPSVVRRGSWNPCLSRRRMKILLERFKGGAAVAPSTQINNI